MALYVLNSWNQGGFRTQKYHTIIFNNETNTLEHKVFLNNQVPNTYPKLSKEIVFAAKELLSASLFLSLKETAIKEIENPSLFRNGDKVMVKKDYYNPYREIIEMDCKFCKGTGYFLKFVTCKVIKRQCIKCHGSGDFQKVGKRVKSFNDKQEYFLIPKGTTGIVVKFRGKRHAVKLRLEDGTLVNVRHNNLRLCKEIETDDMLKHMASQQSALLCFYSIFKECPNVWLLRNFALECLRSK